MKKLMNYFLLMLTLAGALGLQACKEDGPLEEVGENLDDAARDAGDSVEDACEDLTNSNC